MNLARSYCPYCGNSIKESDKFCIMCGKPLVTGLPKNLVEDPSVKSSKKNKKEKKEVSIEEDLDSAVLDEEEEEEKKEEKPEEKEVKTLPDEVKRQIELHLDLIDINQKKQTLGDKLKDLTKQLKSSRYETDFEFGERVEIQLEAVKSVIAEIKEKENELKSQIEGEFIVHDLKKKIETKKDQLRNLMREYKLKKIKDKDVVKSLKNKYKSQLESFESEYNDLILGIKEWIVKLQEEKVDLETEQKTNKARFKAKEIDEERYEKADQEFEKHISSLNSKLEMLKDLTK